jgi:hypothetical protein
VSPAITRHRIGASQSVHKILVKRASRGSLDSQSPKGKTVCPDWDSS